MNWLKSLQNLPRRMTAPAAAVPVGQSPGTGQACASAAPQANTTKEKGDVAEQLALQHLQAKGLRLLARNQHTPGRGGGEIDLVMLAPDGTLVFVEVRARRGQDHGGAAASVGPSKQARIVLAARHYLMRWPGEPPPCRFDVVTVEGEGRQSQINWLQAAFDAQS